MNRPRRLDNPHRPTPPSLSRPGRNAGVCLSRAHHRAPAEEARKRRADAEAMPQKRGRRMAAQYNDTERGRPVPRSPRHQGRYRAPRSLIACCHASRGSRSETLRHAQYAGAHLVPPREGRVASPEDRGEPGGASGAPRPMDSASAGINRSPLAGEQANRVSRGG